MFVMLPAWTRPAARITTGVLVLVCCCLRRAEGQHAATRHPDGYVSDVSGNWYAGSSRTHIRTGDSLFGPVVIVSGRKMQDSAQRIEILLPSRRTLRSDCSDSTAFTRTAACRDTLPLDRAAPRSGWTDELAALASVMSRVVRHEPERYESLIGRGGGVSPNDAVVAWNGAGLDLRPALRSMDGGRYRVCLTRFSTPDSAGAPTSAEASCDVSAVYQYDPRTSRSLPVNLLDPGLFELQIDRGSERGSAWILIRDSSTFQAQARQLLLFRNTLLQWKPRLSPDVIGRLTRAYLVELATRPTKSNEDRRR